MNLLIFRTDIETNTDVKAVQPFFNDIPDIRKWSVDTEDIDNVLRIEASNDLEALDVVRILRSADIYCEELPD